MGGAVGLACLVCVCSICLCVVIGAICRKSRRQATRVVTTADPLPTTAVVTNIIGTVEKSEHLPPGPPENVFNDPAPPYPSAYPQAPYPSQPYPANPGYPPQQEFQQPPPPAYSGKPGGYGGYPHSGYPPSGYPPSGFPPSGYPSSGYPPSGYSPSTGPSY